MQSRFFFFPSIGKCENPLAMSGVSLNFAAEKGIEPSLCALLVGPLRVRGAEQSFLLLDKKCRNPTCVLRQGDCLFVAVFGPHPDKKSGSCRLACSPGWTRSVLQPIRWGIRIRTEACVHCLLDPYGSEVQGSFICSKNRWAAIAPYPPQQNRYCS